MSESQWGPGQLRELIARVRAGDEQAVAELVRRHEPAIRCAARVQVAAELGSSPETIRKRPARAVDRVA